jgi:DNA-binding MarR family transcriptional regulator
VSNARRDLDKPRWLTKKQQAAWRELLGVVIWLPAVLDAQLQRDADISHFEYQVLAMLSTAPERTTHMHELAVRTNSSASRLSHAVARLEKQGWISRAPAPENGRYIRATLTDSGMAKVVDSAPGHVAAVRRNVFDHLSTKQVAQLEEIARTIRNVVAPHTE